MRLCLALLEAAGHEKPSIRRSREAMNRRHTFYRIDDLVLSGIDDDDLVLAAERDIHDRFGEGRLHSQQDGGHAGPNRGTKNCFGFHGLSLHFTMRGQVPHNGRSLNLDRAQPKRVADRRYGGQAHGRSREDGLNRTATACVPRTPPCRSRRAQNAPPEYQAPLFPKSNRRDLALNCYRASARRGRSGR